MADPFFGYSIQDLKIKLHALGLLPVQSGGSDTPAEILTKIKTVDGPGSGLDADTVDGQHAADFATAAQGAEADTAVQPGDLPTFGDIVTHDAAEFATAAQGAEADAVVAEIATYGDIVTHDVAEFATAAQGATADAALPASSYTAADILTKIKTVDGSGSGLDADLLDGISSAGFATAAQGATADAALPAASYTAADVLTKIKTVDGSGSGLDADLLDGISSAGFALAAAGMPTGGATGSILAKLSGTDYDTGWETLTTLAAALAALGFGRSTGDLQPTLKTSADPTWVMLDDGTIGDASSSASNRANADTSALFTLIYNGISDANAPLLTSAGAATNRATQGTAAAAFAAHCRLSLPKALGRAMAVAGSGSGLTARALGVAVGAESKTIGVANLPAHHHNIDPPNTTSAAGTSHTHAVDPPNTTSAAGTSHTHAVDPPNTTTSGESATHIHDISHTHTFTVRNAGAANSSSIPFAGSGTNTSNTTSGASPSTSSPNGTGHTHDVNIASFTSGAEAAHTHDVNIASFTSGAEAAHTHDVNIAAFDSADTGSGTAQDVMNPMTFVNWMIKL